MKALVRTHVGHYRRGNENIIALDSWNLSNRSSETGNEMASHVHSEVASELTVRKYAAKDLSRVSSA